MKKNLNIIKNIARTAESRSQQLTSFINTIDSYNQKKISSDIFSEFISNILDLSRLKTNEREVVIGIWKPEINALRNIFIDDSIFFNSIAGICKASLHNYSSDTFGLAIDFLSDLLKSYLIELQANIKNIAKKVAMKVNGPNLLTQPQISANTIYTMLEMSKKFCSPEQLLLFDLITDATCQTLEQRMQMVFNKYSIIIKSIQKIDARITEKNKINPLKDLNALEFYKSYNTLHEYSSFMIALFKYRYLCHLKLDDNTKKQLYNLSSHKDLLLFAKICLAINEILSNFTHLEIRWNLAKDRDTTEEQKLAKTASESTESSQKLEEINQKITDLNSQAKKNKIAHKSAMTSINKEEETFAPTLEYEETYEADEPKITTTDLNAADLELINFIFNGNYSELNYTITYNRIRTLAEHCGASIINGSGSRRKFRFSKNDIELFASEDIKLNSGKNFSTHTHVMHEKHNKGHCRGLLCADNIFSFKEVLRNSGITPENCNKKINQQHINATKLKM